MKAERRFIALVWLGTKPAMRIELLAIDLVDATAQLKSKYGNAANISLWNEDDANAPRSHLGSTQERLA